MKKRLTRCGVSLLAMIAMHSGGVRPAAAAAITALKPILTDYNATLTLQTVYAADRRNTNQTSTDNNTRQGFRESLGLSTIGYIYHPDIMLFELSGSHGEDQTDLDSNGTSQSLNGGFNNYDLRGTLLRAKPYTFDLFSKRDLPFSTTSTNDQGSEETSQNGVEFNYRKRIYNTKVKFQNTKRVNGLTSDDNDDLDVLADYHEQALGPLKDFSTMLSLLSRTNATDTENSDAANLSQKRQGDGDSKNNTLYNHFGYKMFDFSTNLTQAGYSHNDRSNFLASGGAANTSEFSYDMLNGNENITVELPWHFTSDIGLMYNDTSDDSHLHQNGLNAHNELTSQEKGYNFALTQKLFSSLTTRFTTAGDTINTTTNQNTNGIDQIPSTGDNERKDWGLSSDYQKQLPADSLATASLSTQSNDTNRTGTTADYSTYSKYDGPNSTATIDGNVIQLNNTIDTKMPIVVEVLHDDPAKDTNCGNAQRYPRSTNSCWTPLSTADYALDPTTREIKITGSVQPLLTPTYYNSLAHNALHGPFPFRVTSYLKDAQATTRTDSAGVGLTLFQLLSSRYQHTITTQEGDYGGFQLAPRITEDLVTVGYRTKSLRIELSRRWISGIGKVNSNSTSPALVTETTNDGGQTIDTAKINYDWSKKYLEAITVTLAAEAHTSFESGDGFSKRLDATGNTILDPNKNPFYDPATFSASEDAYTYLLRAATPVPYINALFTASNNYTYTRGQIFRLGFADGALIPSQDLGINQLTLIQNTLTLAKEFHIPWINCVASSYVRYLWQTAHGDQSTDVSRLEYGVNANRAWQVGATTINLAASYSYSDYSSEEELFFRNLQEKWLRTEETAATSVVLTVVRKLM